MSVTGLHTPQLLQPRVHMKTQNWLEKMSASMWRTITDIYTYCNTIPTDKAHGKKDMGRITERDQEKYKTGRWNSRQCKVETWKDREMTSGKQDDTRGEKDENGSWMTDSQNISLPLHLEDRWPLPQRKASIKSDKQFLCLDHKNLVADTHKKKKKEGGRR